VKKYFCRSSKWTSDADVFKLNDEKWLQNYSEAMKFSKWRRVFKKNPSVGKSCKCWTVKIFEVSVWQKKNLSPAMKNCLSVDRRKS